MIVRLVQETESFLNKVILFCFLWCNIWIKIDGSFFFILIKGYLRYKKITSQNVSPEAQIKNFFTS